MAAALFGEQTQGQQQGEEIGRRPNNIAATGVRSVPEKSDNHQERCRPRRQQNRAALIRPETEEEGSRQDEAQRQIEPGPEGRGADQSGQGGDHEEEASNRHRQRPERAAV